MLEMQIESISALRWLSLNGKIDLTRHGNNMRTDIHTAISPGT